MALLQDPIKALDQADWYLANASLEKFPGAFELAAGNLCRQIIEQALFILCFYTGVPRNRFVRPDRSLRTAGVLIDQLNALEKSSNRRFWDVARTHRPSVAKFAKRERSLRRWARELNEPSHFSLRFRRLRCETYKSFISFARGLFDSRDQLMIVAAIVQPLFCKSGLG